MFGMEMIDVAIGIILVYLLLSLVATSIKEAFETVIRARAVFLERGIRELLGGMTEGAPLLKPLYDHPLVSALYFGNYQLPAWANSRVSLFAKRWFGRNLPSYIPASMFARTCSTRDSVTGTRTRCRVS